MSYKSLLVHLDDGPGSSLRVSLALQLATQFEAHLTGLYTVTRPELNAMGVADAFDGVWDAVEEGLRGRSEQSRRRFDSQAQGVGLHSRQWRSVEGPVEEVLAQHARYADLLIVGQPDPSDNPLHRRLDFPAAVAMRSARPVLVLPYAPAVPALGREVLVAWNGSREATRAVADALPLLRKAERVTVMTVNGRDSSARALCPDVDLAHFLALHGVTAKATFCEVPEVEVGAWFLSRAADLGVDLLVMGAYGHSRLRELILGGVTRLLSREMTVPVFMSS